VYKYKYIYLYFLTYGIFIKTNEVYMELKVYLLQERGRSSQLAKALSVTRGFVSMIANGKKKIPLRLALAIENFTNGEVTRKDLRPLDYMEYWPELEDPHDDN
jgi:DNA-binding transcriptional regulator YdaS (Cro superfamily)